MTREKQINPKTLDDELDDELEMVEDELDDELESISDELDDELDDELEDEVEPVENNLVDDLDDDIEEETPETTPLDLGDNLEDDIDNGTNLVNDKYESKSAFDNAIKEFSLNQFMTVKELEDELGEDEITDGLNISDIEDELEDEQEPKVVENENTNVQSAKFRRLERHRALSTSLVTAIESIQERFKDTDKLIGTYSNSVDLGIRMVTSSNRELASKYRFNGMPKILNDNLPNIWGHLQQIKSAGKEINVEEIMSTPLETIIRRQTSYSNLCLYDALKNGFEEAIAINLLTAIKDNIDYDYQQRREKKLKHDSIVEKYKQRYFHDMQSVRKIINSLNEDNTVLVKRVSTDLTEYVCGNPECKDEFIVADNKIAIFANLSVRNSSICLFNPNVCPHCGKVNILSAEEMRRLDFAYRNGKEEIFLQLSNFMTSRTSGYSCSTYGLPDYVVESEIPNIAELVEEPIIEEQKPIMILDCFEAIDRYLGMLKFFDNQTIETGELVSQSDNIIKELIMETKDTEEISTGIVDELEDELDTVESSIESVNTLDETALTEDSSNLSNNDKIQRIALNKTVEFYGSIAKLASTSVSRDYKELKINAISSLIYHFESTNYGDYLKSSPLIYMEGLYKSKSILNEIKDLNEGEFGQLLNDIESAFKSYDIDVEIGETREETINNISKCFDMIQPKIEEFKELRDIHVRKIINRHLELSTLYISNFTIDWNTVTDYVSNPETARLIDLITDTMIISLVAEDYYYLLFSGLKDKDIARLKDFAGKADEYYKKTTDYMIKSDIITGIDKKNLRNSLRNEEANMLPFPDIDLSSVIRIYPKLQIYLGKDEFNTLLILEDILSKFNYDEEEEIAIENDNLNKFFIFKELVKHKAIISSVLDKYGRDENGRYLYYFHDLFSKEEILNSNVNFEGDISVIYDKFENESFSDYMELYSNTSDVDKDRDCKLVSTSMTKILKDLAVDLDAIGMVHNAFLDTAYIKNVNIYVFVMNFMFMLNKYLSVEQGLIKLNFTRNTRNILLSSLPKLNLSSKLNYNFLKDILVLSFLYTDSDVNAFIFYDRDIEEVDNDGNIREVAIDSVEDRISMLRKEPNLLLSSSEHIPQKEKEIIHEYFGGRE